MSESSVLMQYVVFQRNQEPTGFRILPDGKVQRCVNNGLPSATERLDMDKDLTWQDESNLSEIHLATVQDAIRASGIFEMEPRLLINYCKDDPGTGIWTVNLDDQSARVVVFDPRPKRNAALDVLLQTVNAVMVP